MSKQNRNPTEQEKMELAKLLVDTYNESNNRYNLLLKALSWGIVGVVLGMLARFVILIDFVVLNENQDLLLTTIAVVVLSVGVIIALMNALYYAWQVRKRIDNRKIGDIE